MKLLAVAAAAFFVAPAFAAGTPVDAPATEGCLTWQKVEQDLVLNGIEFVRIQFQETFGVAFQGMRAAVLVHQIGGLAIGFEDDFGCMSVPLALAPELPTA